LEEPAAFIFRVKVMVYSEVGVGDRPEDVGRSVYVVGAVALRVVVVVIIIVCYTTCSALHWLSECSHFTILYL
jgi:hypothetical protein